MKIIMVGPPGAGKGSQAKIIAKRCSIPHISTGDMFRNALKKETPMGLKAKKYMDKGELVPDKVVNGLVEERLSQEDCLEGFILDGYPRTVNQAEALTNILEKKQQKNDFVISINVSDNEVVRRLTGRRTCLNCGAIYHIDYNPPKKKGICDNCQHKLVQREDDQKSTVLNRLEVYKKQTEPLLKYYKQRDLLVEIDGEQEIKKVTSDIIDVLEADCLC